MTGIVNVLAVLAFLGLVIGVAFGVADLARECWQPEHVDIPPGYRILPRQPYDFDSET